MIKVDDDKIYDPATAIVYQLQDDDTPAIVLIQSALEKQRETVRILPAAVLWPALLAMCQPQEQAQDDGELRPCAWCGEKPEQSSDTRGYYCMCPKGAEVRGNDEPQARRRWNAAQVE